MLSIRPLTKVDEPQLIELCKLNPTVFNYYTDDQIKDSQLILISSIFSNPLYFTLGAFIDDVLYGCIIAKEAESTPSWTWGHWITRPNFFKLMFNNHDYKKIIEGESLLFDEMENNRNLNRFFIFYNLDENDQNSNIKYTLAGHEKRLLWAKKYNLRVANYNFYTDCIIEPNTFPKYAYQKSIAMNRTWPMKTIIRMGIKSE